jgi:hypothetical protein
MRRHRLRNQRPRLLPQIPHTPNRIGRRFRFIISSVNPNRFFSHSFNRCRNVFTEHAFVRFVQASVPLPAVSTPATSPSFIRNKKSLTLWPAILPLSPQPSVLTSVSVSSASLWLKIRNPQSLIPNPLPQSEI